MSMRSLIKLHGSEVTIYKKNEGSLDAYGDPAIAWTPEDDKEYVWIQHAMSARSPQMNRTPAGNIDISTFIGLLFPTSVIVTGDILKEDSGIRYKVGRILNIPLIRDKSHKEAHLMLMTEGN